MNVYLSTVKLSKSLLLIKISEISKNKSPGRQQSQNVTIQNDTVLSSRRMFQV